jgi:hypothetical protein
MRATLKEIGEGELKGENFVVGNVRSNYYSGAFNKRDHDDS